MGSVQDYQSILISSDPACLDSMEPYHRICTRKGRRRQGQIKITVILGGEGRAASALLVSTACQHEGILGAVRVFMGPTSRDACSYY